MVSIGVVALAVVITAARAGAGGPGGALRGPRAEIALCGRAPGRGVPTRRAIAGVELFLVLEGDGALVEGGGVGVGVGVSELLAVVLVVVAVAHVLDVAVAGVGLGRVVAGHGQGHAEDGGKQVAR